MKKLLIMLVLLAMAGAANAASVWFQVDPQDAADSYMPSDIITINLVADFGVGSVSLNIGADGGSAEAVGALNAKLATALAPYYNGTLRNTLNILISDIAGGAAFGQPTPAAGEVLYSFEFHVPDVPPSTIITINDVTGPNPFGGAPMSTAVASPDYMVYLTDILPVEIHVIPEPMTIALLGLGGLFLRRRR